MISPTSVVVWEESRCQRICGDTCGRKRRGETYVDVLADAAVGAHVLASVEVCVVEAGDALFETGVGHSEGERYVRSVRGAGVTEGEEDILVEHVGVEGEFVAHKIGGSGLLGVHFERGGEGGEGGLGRGAGGG